MDYQAQGRYCFPALLPIALLSAKGVEQLVFGIADRKLRGAFVFAFCLLLGFVAGSSYVLFRSLL
jgi:hypothetical protein